MARVGISGMPAPLVGKPACQVAFATAAGQLRSAGVDAAVTSLPRTVLAE